MKKTLKLAFALVLLIVAVVLLALLKSNQAVAEWFSTTVFVGWVNFVGHVNSIFPFSVFEVLLYVAVVFAVVFLVWAITLFSQRKWTKGANKFLILCIVATSILTVYMSTASMAYNREKLPIIEYNHTTSQEKMDAHSAKELAQFYADKLNQVSSQLERNQDGTVKMPSFDEIFDLLMVEFEKLDNGYFSQYTPKAKQLTSKWLFGNLKIAGVSFVVTGEPNVGSGNFYNLPQVMAHEIAHTKGVMRESDANSVAYYVLLNSNNPYLQYAVLADVASSITTMVRKMQNQENPSVNSEFNFNSLLDEQTFQGIVADKVAYGRYWSQFTAFEDLGTWLNDVYLKLMGQSDGVGSYVEEGTSETQDKTDENGNQVQVEVVISFSNFQNILIDHFLKIN